VTPAFKAAAAKLFRQALATETGVKTMVASPHNVAGVRHLLYQVRKEMGGKVMKVRLFLPDENGREIWLIRDDGVEDEKE